MQSELTSIRTEINDCTQLFHQVQNTARETVAKQIRALDAKEADILTQLRLHGSTAPRSRQSSSTSFDRQQARIEAFVAARKALGWAITRTVIDADKSGTSLDRSGVKELLKGASAGMFDVLLVETNDRLSRDWCELNDLLKALAVSLSGPPCGQ